MKKPFLFLTGVIVVGTTGLSLWPGAAPCLAQDAAEPAVAAEPAAAPEAPAPNAGPADNALEDAAESQFQAADRQRRASDRRAWANLRKQQANNEKAAPQRAVDEYLRFGERPQLHPTVAVAVGAVAVRLLASRLHDARAALELCDSLAQKHGDDPARNTITALLQKKTR